MAAMARAEWKALGTTAVVVTAEEGGIEAARRAVVAELEAIDRACSRFRPDSELEAVNEAGGRPVEVSPLFLEAVDIALRAAAATDGDVDPTVGGAMRVLGYDRDFAAVPHSGRAVAWVARVPGWQLVRLDPSSRTVHVPAGVRLDLGATAKALAADRAAGAAANAAGCGVLVSLGGDIAVAGAAPEGGWLVKATDSHQAGADAEGQTVCVGAGGVATSGTTVRRWTRGNETLHHVVDPATGRPATVVWRTVTAAARSCVDANVATTAAIVRGERSPGWLESLGVPARLVRPDGSVVCVGGWPSAELELERTEA
jgi:thiamine biosynthesis lipoprotein